MSFVLKPETIILTVVAALLTVHWHPPMLLVSVVTACCQEILTL